jgi:hypothetical protein
MNRNSLTRLATIAVIPVPSFKKIDKDIIKHASRIRRLSPSKDQLTKTDSTTITNPSLRTHQNTKRDSSHKPLKSMSLVSFINEFRIFVNFFINFSMNMMNNHDEKQVIK